MATVKVSPKYQVVIPRDVRERLGIKAGEDVQIFLYDGRIEFVPVAQGARDARDAEGDGHPGGARRGPAVILVDSCGWLEYLADGPHAGAYAKAIEKTTDVLVPTVCILEVFKKVLQERGEGPALEAAALMQQGLRAQIDAGLAMNAAKRGSDLGLPARRRRHPRDRPRPRRRRPHPRRPLHKPPPQRPLRFFLTTSRVFPPRLQLRAA